MSELNNKKEIINITLTSDDEEPKCIRCDNVCSGLFCDLLCGPDHGWSQYARTISLEDFKLEYFDDEE